MAVPSVAKIGIALILIGTLIMLWAVATSFSQLSNHFPFTEVLLGGGIAAVGAYLVFGLAQPE